MLTDLQARKVKPDSKALTDKATRGLYLFPSGSVGTEKWIFRYVSPITGKRRDMGLGRYPEISIRDARAAALECRRLIETGVDPLEAKRAQNEQSQRGLAMPTFADAARKVHTELSPGFRNAKHSAQWINTFEQ
jgi:hypothetical protein